MMNIFVLFHKYNKETKIKFVPIAEEIKRIFNGSTFYTLKEFGSDLFDDNSIKLDFTTPFTMLYDIPSIFGRLIIRNSINVVVTVGSDALSSVLANSIISSFPDKNKRPLMFSVSSEDKYYGPIVSFTLDDLKELNYSQLRQVKIDAIEVSNKNGVIGYAFNEMRLGDTIIGTYKGKQANVCVRDYIYRKRMQIRQPEKCLGDDDFTVLVDGEKRVTRHGYHVMDIIASPFQFDKIYGRSIFGSFSNIENKDEFAGLIIAHRKINELSVKPANSKKISCIEQLVFSNAETIKIEGLIDDLYAILDDFPHSLDGNEAIIKLKNNEIICLKKQKNNES